MIRRVLNGVGASAFERLAIAATQLLLVPVQAQHWGAHVYGIWILISTVPAFLAISDFGFATAAGTSMTMEVARGNREEAVHIFQSAWAAILVSSFIMMLAAVALAWALPNTIFAVTPEFPIHQIRVTLTVMMLYGIASLQGTIFLAGFRCTEMFALGTSWQALFILFEGLAVIAVVMLGGGPVAAAATFLLGRSVCLFALNTLLRHRVPWLAISLKQARWRRVKTLLAPAGAVMVLPLAQAFLLQGTAIALGAGAGELAIPAFTASRTLSRLGLQMCVLLTSALMPEFSAAYGRRDRQAQANMLLITLLSSAFVLLPYALIFGLFGPEVVHLWTGGAIVAPRSLMIAMGVATCLGGVWFPISNLILAMNKQATYSLWFVLFALASMPLAYLLSRAMGATGAAIALASVDATMCFVIGRIAFRLIARWSDLSAAVPVFATFVRGQIARTRDRLG